MRRELAEAFGVDEVEPGVRPKGKLLELLVAPDLEMLAEIRERGLLDELTHVAVGIRQEHAVLFGHLGGSAEHRRHRHDRAAALVRFDHRLEVEVDDRVRREHQRTLRDVPVVHHPKGGVGAALRERVVLHRRVLHVDAESLAVPDHDLDLIPVLLTVRDDVVVHDPLARENLEDPSDQAAAEERHRRLGAEVTRRLQRERARPHPLPPGEADPDEIR